LFAIININMRRVVVFLIFCLLTFTTESVFAQNSTPQGQWRWFTVDYKSPTVGILTPLQIGYFVTHEQNPRILNYVVRRNNENLVRNQDELITFSDKWQRGEELLLFTVVVRLVENDRFIITVYASKQISKDQIEPLAVEPAVTNGRLPLTDKEFEIAQIIAHSKGSEAQENNEKLGVSDVDLARALIFASYYYGVPLYLLVALVCQESKFDAGSTDRTSIKGIAQLSGAAIDDVENIYFRQPHIIEKIRHNPQMRPNRTYLNHYFHNLLYAAAYLDHLHTSVRNLMPTAADQEVWKFVCVWYNFGMGAGQNAWEQAGRPIAWNTSFSEHLDSGEKRIYSGSIHFYMSKIAEGEKNLFQYHPGMVNASQRLNFVRQFNNLPNL